MAKPRKSTRGPYLAYVELLHERIQDASRYPYHLPCIRKLERLELHPHVTFLVGENGSGKSTLLEAIAVGCGLNPEGGSRNFNFSTFESHSPLGDCLRHAWTTAKPSDCYFLRAESFYNVASEIQRLDEIQADAPKIIKAYGEKSLHEQSHGESFFALFKNRFRPFGLYLMDEPEAALSPKRQLEFLALLHNYVQGGAQFIIATHSPMIMAYPNAQILQLGPDGLQQVSYQDTEHYQVTRGFLNNHQHTLSVLMAGRSKPTADPPPPH